MLNWFTTLGRRWIGSTVPWTNVYGLARTLLALSSALTLAVNDSSTLFRPVAGILEVAPFCGGARRFGAFCIMPSLGHELTRWLCVAILLLVASGYRPRYTGILHWWVVCSYQASGIVLEGGDQIAAILSFLLIPITLTDPRRWHWQTPSTEQASSEVGRLLSAICLTGVRLQVAVIYFHAAIGKIAVSEWANGTAIYYWASHPVFGAPAWLRPLVMPILANAYAISAVTWSVLVVELALGMALVMSHRGRSVMLALGLLLHFGIALLHGLVTFSIIMSGALILYLRPLEVEFKVPSFLNIRALRQRLNTAPEAPALKPQTAA